MTPTTTCTGTRCAGMRFPGHILRCPNCAGTLLFYHGPMALFPKAAKTAAA